MAGMNEMAMIMSLLTNGVTAGSNVLGQGMNMAQLLDKWMRYGQRQDDPTLQAVREITTGRYNTSPYGPFGDPTASYGGLWGNYQANPETMADFQHQLAALDRQMGQTTDRAEIERMGKQQDQIRQAMSAQTGPVSFGDMAARQMDYMMNANPGNAALANMGQVAAMQRPQSGGSFQSMYGGNPQGQAYQPQAMNWQTPAPTTSTQVTGATAPSPSMPPLPFPQKPDNALINAVNTQTADLAAALEKKPISERIQGLAQNRAQQLADAFAVNSQPKLPTGHGNPTGGIPGMFAGNRPAKQMPSYAVGTRFVPQTGPAVLHRGEAVIPAAQNPFRSVRQPAAAPTAAPAPTPAPAPQPVQAPAQTGGLGQRFMDRLRRPQTPAPAPVASPAPQPSPAPAPQPVQAPPVQQPVSQQTVVPPPQTQAVNTSQAPAQAPQTLNDQRAGLMSNIMQNPMSMTPQVQQQMFQGIADTRDRAMADQQRQIREAMAARGLGNSGIQDKLMFDAQLARQGDLSAAQRDIGVAAAQTNFADQLNAANTAIQHQLGLGNAALQYDQYQNQLFNQDRDFYSQLAGQQYATSVQAQQQQQNMLNMFNMLVNSGMNYDAQQVGQILSLFGQQYTDPDTMQMSPMRYMQWPSMQQGGGGGTGSSSDSMWDAIGQIGGSGLGLLI